MGKTFAKGTMFQKVLTFFLTIISLKRQDKTFNSTIFFYLNISKNTLLALIISSWSLHIPSKQHSIDYCTNKARHWCQWVHPTALCNPFSESSAFGQNAINTSVSRVSGIGLLQCFWLARRQNVLDPRGTNLSKTLSVFQPFVMLLPWDSVFYLC